MHKQLLPLIAFSALAFQSCKKDSPSSTNRLAKSIEWDYGMKATIDYDQDSTIKSITHIGLGTSSLSYYTWTNKQVV